MESENEAAKPVVTIARYQDRIPTDKTPEQAAAIHGPGAVYVDGKCYADIFAEAKPVFTPSFEIFQGTNGFAVAADPQTEAPAVAAAKGVGE